MMTTFSSGCGAAPALCSRPAVMVSSLRFVLARPPHAMNAMSSLPFRFRPRRIAGAPVMTPAAATAPPTNSRRVICRWRVFLADFFMECPPTRVFSRIPVPTAMVDRVRRLRWPRGGVRSSIKPDGLPFLEILPRPQLRPIRRSSAENRRSCRKRCPNRIDFRVHQPLEVIAESTTGEYSIDDDLGKRRRTATAGLHTFVVSRDRDSILLFMLTNPGVAAKGVARR